MVSLRCVFALPPTREMEFWMSWREVQLDYGIPATQIWHGTTRCQSMMRLADGTTWHSLIVMGCFLLVVLGKRYPETGLRKIYGRKSVHITNSPLVFPYTSCLGQVSKKLMFGFFSTLRTCKDGKWVVFNVD